MAAVKGTGTQRIPCFPYLGGLFWRFLDFLPKKRFSPEGPFSHATTHIITTLILLGTLQQTLWSYYRRLKGGAPKKICKPDWGSNPQPLDWQQRMLTCGQCAPQHESHAFPTDSDSLTPACVKSGWGGGARSQPWRLLRDFSLKEDRTHMRWVMSSISNVLTLHTNSCHQRYQQTTCNSQNVPRTWHNMRGNTISQGLE